MSQGSSHSAAVRSESVLLRAWRGGHTTCHAGVWIAFTNRFPGPQLPVLFLLPKLLWLRMSWFSFPSCPLPPQRRKMPSCLIPLSLGSTVSAQKWRDPWNFGAGVEKKARLVLFIAGHRSFGSSDAVLSFESTWHQRDLLIFPDGPLWDFGPVTWKEFKEQNDSIITKYLFFFSSRPMFTKKKRLEMI